MKYRLARQQSCPETDKVIANVIKRQKIAIPRASEKVLKEIAQVSKLIEKEGLPSYLVCKKLPGELGRGIFLHPEAKPIKRGQTIAPYSGVISLIPQNEGGDSNYAFSSLNDLRINKEEHELLNSKQRFHPRRLYWVSLDAEKRGNFTRFINHSSKPNVDAHLLRIPKNSHGLHPSPAEIIYIANRTIHPGEQLLVCYEDEDKSYWGALKIKPFPMTPKTFTIDPSGNLKKQTGRNAL